MKLTQSDLKHLTWRSRWRCYRTASGAELHADHADQRSKISVASYGWMTLEEMAEVARIVEHYRLTKQFAPDEAEPTMPQVRRWLEDHGWSPQASIAGAEYWGLGSWPKHTARITICFDDDSNDVTAIIDCVSLLTQLYREQIVREMVIINP